MQSKELEYQEAKEALLASEKSNQKVVAQNSLLQDEVEGFKHLIEDKLNNDNVHKAKDLIKSSTDQQIEVIEKLLKT